MPRTFVWRQHVAFYLLYLFGIVYFAALPALTSGGWRRAFLNGALLGLVAYGTYDLTNQATLRHWPFLVTTLDMIVGCLFDGRVGCCEPCRREEIQRRDKLTCVSQSDHADDNIHDAMTVNVAAL